MGNDELTRTIAKHVFKMMAIKWTIIIGLNKIAKHLAKKAGEKS